MPEITVVDSIMGSGKTEWAIQSMNAQKDERFIYVTPYIDEITNRIIKRCKRFRQPSDEDSPTKQRNFEYLLREGMRIATTHELFKRCPITDRIIEGIRVFRYTLILDEVIDVVEKINITKQDFDNLFNLRYVTVDDETGFVKWIDDNYSGEYNTYKRIIKTKAVIKYEDNMFLWLFPPELLKAFNKIYILTYMFSGSYMEQYMRINNLTYELCYVDKNNEKTNGDVVTYILHKGKQDIRGQISTIASNIRIYTGNLNAIGNHKSDLNWTWWENANAKRKKCVYANAYEYLHNVCDAKSDHIMWTVYKGRRKSKPTINRRWASCFCPCNARATNKYNTCNCLAYLINVNPDPNILAWFRKNGGSIDAEQYALSQLLQWIWRSAIREENPIFIYLPSQRMRDLLTDWLGIDRIL